MTRAVCITLNWILYGIARLQYSTVPYCTPPLSVYQVRDILYVLNTYTAFAIALVGKGVRNQVISVNSIVVDGRQNAKSAMAGGGWQ